MASGVAAARPQRARAVSVSALSALFESAPGALIQRGPSDDTESDFVALIEAGLLCEHAAASTVLCADCGGAHFVGVEWNEARSARGRFCAGGGGWSEVDPESLRRYSFDHGMLLMRLAHGLGLKGPPETLVDGACWLLGYPVIADKQIAIVVAREMNDPKRVWEIAHTMRGRFLKRNGIILCGVRPMVDLGLFPKGIKMAAFDDVVTLDVKGDVVVDSNAVALALGLKRRGRGQHGAPSDHPGLIGRIEERARVHGRPISPQAEADALLADPSWVNQNRPLPNRKSLARFLARLATK